MPLWGNRLVLPTKHAAVRTTLATYAGARRGWGLPPPVFGAHVSPVGRKALQELLSSHHVEHPAQKMLLLAPHTSSICVCNIPLVHRIQHPSAVAQRFARIAF